LALEKDQQEINLWTSSDPITRMKVASVLLATALAHKVFPVPGGPYKRTPLGGSIPKFTKRSGFFLKKKKKKNQLDGQKLKGKCQEKERIKKKAKKKGKKEWKRT